MARPDFVPTGVADSADLGLAVVGFLLFFEVAAMGSKVSPASGRWMAHPIGGMIQLRVELRRPMSTGWAQEFSMRFEDFR